MKAKRELIFSSLLAISLALGLGYASLRMFGAAPPITPSETVLDVYTRKAGIGPNASGGVFETLDAVSLYAYLTKGGTGVNDTAVTFTVRAPDAREMVRDATTNGSGIASTVFSFLPAEGRVVGTWDVIANTTVGSTSVMDELTLQAETEEAQLILLAKRDYAVSNVFLPNETVVLEAQASYRNASMDLLPINFTVLTPSGTVFLAKADFADADGVANVTFQIPWLPSPSSLGIWQATVEAVIYEESLNATASFECRLLPVTIDVFTQKGGYGPNALGGTFVVNENVSIYAQIRDQFNKTAAAGWFVGFEIRTPLNQSIPGFGYTDDTGTADYIHPYRDVGTYVVYATADYFDAYGNSVKVIDTLTFTVTSQ